MARSRWKLKYFSNSIWRKIIFIKTKNNFRRKRLFYDRSSTIPRCFSTYAIRVHKGTKSRKLLINLYNIGYKFGEFSYTRKPYHFPLRKSKKRKNNFVRR